MLWRLVFQDPVSEPPGPTLGPGAFRRADNDEASAPLAEEGA